jgi:hypothetical protein
MHQSLPALRRSSVAGVKEPNARLLLILQFHVTWPRVVNCCPTLCMACVLKFDVFTAVKALDKWSSGLGRYHLQGEVHTPRPYPSEL